MMASRPLRGELVAQISGADGIGATLWLHFCIYPGAQVRSFPRRGGLLAQTNGKDGIRAKLWFH